MLRDLLWQDGTRIGRLHVATLMKKIEIEAIHRRLNTSKPALGHKIYPYLLRKLAIVWPNQVWGTDIKYIPMAKSFGYLAAIVDWFSRKVLAWRGVDLGGGGLLCRCSGRGTGALRQTGDFNTDQGSHFTSQAFISVLRRKEVAISMDGRARGATMS